MEQIIGSGQETVPADVVKDATTATFVADVLEASREVPVIVDLWAPWCGPCKHLGPLLEKVVRDAGGKVRLVKLNIDENPEVAQQLRVQSIPAVIAFRNGQPLDGFVGALPESQVKQFVERLAGPIGPSPIEQALDQADAVYEAGDATTAKAIYNEVLKREPDTLRARGQLARCHVTLGELSQARALLDAVDEKTQDTPEIAGALAALALAEEAGSARADMAALERRLEQDPNDHQARFDLAMAQYAAGQHETAVDQLLEIVRRDREWSEQAARTQLLKFFGAFGQDDPLTVSGRRRLSAILFS